MQNNIRNTNLRFNLGKEQQRRAWEYLQTMDRQDFKSYSQVISLALVDYFDRYYRTQADPYLETREREELFVKQIVDAVENSLKQALPLFLSGLTAGMVQREPQIRASFPTCLQSARTEKSAMTVSGCVLLLLQSVSQKVLPVPLFPDRDQPECGSSGQNNRPVQGRLPGCKI